MSILLNKNRGIRLKILEYQIHIRKISMEFATREQDADAQGVPIN